MIINQNLSKINDNGNIEDQELNIDDFNNEKYLNLKQDKFELLIEDINEALSDSISAWEMMRLTAKIISGLVINPLNLLFNNDTKNLYSKIILEKAIFPISNWAENYTIQSLTNINTKIKATKDFIHEYRMPENRDQALIFSFWSLFTITVDKTSYNENLSLVSDFLYLLRIDDGTLIDIIQVIKVIFRERDENFKFQTEEVPILFNGVLNLFR